MMKTNNLGQPDDTNYILMKDKQAKNDLWRSTRGAATLGVAWGSLDSTEKVLLGATVLAVVCGGAYTVNYVHNAGSAGAAGGPRIIPDGSGLQSEGFVGKATYDKLQNDYNALMNGKDAAVKAAAENANKTGYLSGKGVEAKARDEEVKKLSGDVSALSAAKTAAETNATTLYAKVRASGGEYSQGYSAGQHSRDSEVTNLTKAVSAASGQATVTEGKAITAVVELSPDVLSMMNFGEDLRKENGVYTNDEDLRMKIWEEMMPWELTECKYAVNNTPHSSEKYVIVPRASVMAWKEDGQPYASFSINKDELYALERQEFFDRNLTADGPEVTCVVKRFVDKTKLEKIEDITKRAVNGIESWLKAAGISLEE